MAMELTQQLQHAELVRDNRRLRDTLADSEGSLKYYFEHIAQYETSVAVMRREADGYARELQATRGTGKVAAVLRHQRERAEQSISSTKALRQRVEAEEEQHLVKKQNHYQRRKFFVDSRAQMRDDQRVADVSLQNVIERMNDFAFSDRTKQAVFADRCDARADEHAKARVAASEDVRRHNSERERLLLGETDNLTKYHHARLDLLHRLDNEEALAIAQGDGEITRIQETFEGCRDDMLRSARAGDRAEEYGAKLKALEAADHITEEELRDTDRRLQALVAECDVRRPIEASREKEITDRISNHMRSVTTLKRKLAEVRRAAVESRSMRDATASAPLDDHVQTAAREGQRLEYEHAASQRALQASLQEAAAVATLATDRLAEEAAKGHRLEAELNRAREEVRVLRERDALSRHESSAMAEQLIRNLA